MSTYISPYKTFELLPNANEFQIEHQRKRLLLQLTNHNSKEEIYLNGTKMTKDRAFGLLEELMDDTKRKYHKEIYNNKKLLNFLEYGHLNYLRTQQPTAMSKEEGFYQFIAPYFAEQYSETLIDAIKTQNTETLRLLSENSLPIVADFEEHCYRDANHYVQDTINNLKKLQKDVKVDQLSEHQLMAYLPNKTIELYNMLPDYFFVARNLIGNEIYQVALVLAQRFGRRDGATVLIKQGLKLRLDKTVHQNLQDLLEQFKLRYKVPSFVVLGIMAVLLLFFIKYLEDFFFAG